MPMDIEERKKGQGNGRSRVKEKQAEESKEGGKKGMKQKDRFELEKARVRSDWWLLLVIDGQIILQYYHCSAYRQQLQYGPVVPGTA